MSGNVTSSDNDDKRTGSGDATLGSVFRSVRESLKWSRDTTAEKLDCSAATIERAEERDWGLAHMNRARQNDAYWTAVMEALAALGPEDRVSLHSGLTMDQRLRRLSVEFGDVARSVDDAELDNHWDRSEVAAALKEIRELKRACDSLEREILRRVG